MPTLYSLNNEEVKFDPAKNRLIAIEYDGEDVHRFVATDIPTTTEGFKRIITGLLKEELTEGDTIVCVADQYGDAEHVLVIIGTDNIFNSVDTLLDDVRKMIFMTLPAEYETKLDTLKHEIETLRNENQKLKMSSPNADVLEMNLTLMGGAYANLQEEHKSLFEEYEAFKKRVEEASKVEDKPITKKANPSDLKAETERISKTVDEESTDKYKFKYFM